MKDSFQELKGELIVERPWGRFIEFVQNKKATVKILEIKPKGVLSLQYHLEREELWYVMQGRPIVTIGKLKKELKPGEQALIKKSVRHRLENNSTGKILVLEIALGHFHEDDEVRLKDIYHRRKNL